MPKFCPKCKSEFKDSVKLCPKDGIELVNHILEDNLKEFVDIYIACDEIEAERIVSFLSSDNIDAHSSKTGISQLPVASDNQHVICVPKKLKTQAQVKIRQAQQDSIISSSGNFLDE